MEEMTNCLRRWLLSSALPLTSVVGYRVGKAVRVLEYSPGWSDAAMAAHQDECLRALINHCYRNVPYYHDLMSSKQLHPDDFRTIQDLAKLPYLTREIIRSEGKRLRAINYPDRICQFRRSGGTTGEPIGVAVNSRARSYEVASTLRGWRWMNYELGRPMVRLFGGSLGLNKRSSLKGIIGGVVLNTRFLPAFEINEETVTQYYETIMQATGGVLVGYASAVMNLVEHMSRKGFRGSPLRSVICTAEHMPMEWRQRIMGCLGVPVYCYYGCGEVNGLAYEGAHFEGYAVSEEHVILEVGASDSTVFCNEGRGEACITALFNYAMPLIRYRNGDIVELKRVTSGYPHLRISSLDGRVMDQLLASDGHVVSSVLPTHLVFKTGAPFWKYQVVQTEIDRITFHYMLNSGEVLSAEIRDTIVGSFKKYLGNGLQLSFVRGKFETAKSGKHRFVINRLLY